METTVWAGDMTGNWKLLGTATIDLGGGNSNWNGCTYFSKHTKEKSNKPVKIIYSGNWTHCWFEDGDKQSVECKEEYFDKAVGVALCIAQHVYGTKTKFHKSANKGYVQVKKEKE